LSPSFNKIIQVLNKTEVENRLSEERDREEYKNTETHKLIERSRGMKIDRETQEARE
jgi:hypothetical protein